MVTIPSVALAEYLAGDRLPDSVFEQVDIETASVYVVLELSAEAAKIAAKIWRKGVKPLAQPAGGRQSLKANIYICASAIAHKVSKIITNDPHFIELLKGSEVEVVIVDKLPMDLVDALTGKD